MQKYAESRKYYVKQASIMHFYVVFKTKIEFLMMRFTFVSSRLFLFYDTQIVLQYYET